MTHDEIIEELGRRARAGVDEGQELRAPAPAELLSSAEPAVGFTLPTLLERIWTELGNGGSALFPRLLPFDSTRRLGELVVKERSADGRRLVEVSEVTEYSEPDTALSLYHPSQYWPVGMLPIVDWGCGMYSCVYCMDDDYPVYRFNTQHLELDEDGQPIVDRDEVEDEDEEIDPLDLDCWAIEADTIEGFFERALTFAESNEVFDDGYH